MSFKIPDGGAAPNSLEHVKFLAAHFYTESPTLPLEGDAAAQVEKWLDTRHEGFQNQIPRTLVERGEGQRVVDALWSLLIGDGGL